jgi:hypothetical protein
MSEFDNEILTELRAQTGWLRVLAAPILRAQLERLLTTGKKRRVFEMTTGDATVRDIASGCGVGLGTVSRWWADWVREGVARTVGPQGRVAHLVSLASLGMGLDPEAAPLGSSGKEED